MSFFYAHDDAFSARLLVLPFSFCISRQFFASALYYTSRHREEGKNQRNAGELRHRHGSPMADIGIQRHEDVGLDWVDSSPSSCLAADVTALPVYSVRQECSCSKSSR